MNEENKNITMKRENKIITMTSINGLVLRNLKANHLCSKCENCSPRCLKVYDVTKKTIDKYPFITDGVSIGNDNPDIIVTGCDNYEPYAKRDTTGLRAKAKELCAIYYNTESFEEALKIQEYNRNHGIEKISTDIKTR